MLPKFSLKLLRDSRRLSHLILALFLGLGFFGSLFASSLTSQNLEARLLSSALEPNSLPYDLRLRKNRLTESTNNHLAESTYYQKLTKAKLNNQPFLKQECQSARSSKTWAKFLQDFEDSFAGVLPGIGRVLLENPNLVTDRRERFIFEIMRFYANLKFCVAADNFTKIYQNYGAVIGELGIFTQIRALETATETLAPQPRISQPNPYPSLNAALETLQIIKDLESTEKYITETLDRAIASAIELDRQTDLRLVNLSTQTTNQLIATTNGLITLGNEIGNRNLKFDLMAIKEAELQRQINACLLAFAEKEGNTLKKTAVNSQKKCAALFGNGAIYQEPTENLSEQIGPVPFTNPAPPSVLLELQRNGQLSEQIANLSYGLLNLLTKEIRATFLQQRFGPEYVIWVAVLNGQNPFNPGEQTNLATLKTYLKSKLIPALYTKYLCPAIEDSQQKCLDKNLIYTSQTGPQLRGT